MFLRIAAPIALVSAGLIAAIACGKQLPHPPYSPQSTADLVAVSSEPPPARVELMPPSPQPSAVWVDGQWTYERRRWIWQPGRWVEPIPNATYSPWVTARATDGALYLAKGVWRDADGGVIDDPKPLVLAAPEPGVVFDPNGDVAKTGSVALAGLLDASADATRD